ncbi:hypothetical protein G9A89_019376 [Geosiphon pyriformis]|nr:hypothetical protein G9A89_019376 [Geosiphon pyriformis]
MLYGYLVTWLLGYLYSLASFVECIDKLVKRLDLSGPTVSQSSLGCQPLVTLLLQNQGVDIVIGEGSSVATSSKTIMEMAVFNSLIIFKMEKTLNNLSIMVISFLAKINNTGLVSAYQCLYQAGRHYLLTCRFWKYGFYCYRNKFDGMKIFSSGLDKRFLGAGMAIIMNNFLTRHVSKIEEILGHLTSVQLLFKGKLSVIILGLYAGVFAETRFGQACKINFLIVKAVNSFMFVVLSSNFNENRSRKSASFKFCSDLELVNFFSKYSLIIDYIFVSKSLLSVLASHKVVSVSDFFDTNYNAVLVLVGLSGFLNAWLNSDHIQANKDKECLLNKFLKNIDMFNNAKDNKNLDTMWEILKEVIINSADYVFSRYWFSEFDCPKNKQSSKFFKLELLMVKLVKCLSSGQESKTVYLFKIWSTLDSKGVFKAYTMFNNSKGRGSILQHLLECLKQPFKKIVLDHLIVDNELILESKKVKSAVDSIMEKWTRKWVTSISLLVCWSNQYALLDYVSNNAFSNIMNVIRSDKFLLVVKELLDGKAAGIFGIPNKLWKHGDAQILGGLLNILNVCLELGAPYNWKEALTNTRPIALVKTARKILSKVISNRISLAYSEFNVLYGNNFSVLKGTSTQTPIFTIGFIIENALEKNREL